MREAVVWETEQRFDDGDGRRLCMMRSKWLWRMVLALVVLLALSVPVLADDGGDGVVRFGEDLTVRSGDVIRGDAVVFGANAAVERGGIVAGDLAVMGGSASIEGEVTGVVAVFGGNVDLRDGCLVAGDVVSFGGTVSQGAGARVGGQVFSGLRWSPFARWPVPWSGEERPSVPPGVGQPLGWWNAAFGGLLDLIWGIFGALITTLLMAGLAFLALLFLLPQTERVMQCLETAWPAALGVGLLTLIAVVSVSLVLLITVCLAPLGILLLLAGLVAWVWGVIAIGALVGERLFQALKVNETTLPIKAAVGTGLVVLVSHTPCVGWLLGLVVGILGLGAVVLTRFGTQAYAPASAGGGAPSLEAPGPEEGGEA